MSEKTRTKNFDFEKAIAKLEKIVQKLESETLPLEQSLSAFEEGVKLIRDCRSYLEQAKAKVEELVLEQGGFPQIKQSDVQRASEEND